ncbi:MAG: hypothetical protein ABSH09_05535 [Bryobacteraceae bacterium]|jgi:hypothetical protein
MAFVDYGSAVIDGYGRALPQTESRGTSAIPDGFARDVARFLKHIVERIGEREAAICSITVTEPAQGIYRANTIVHCTARREFLDGLN